MKIRQGFVSNSSSSSFFIAGVEVKDPSLDFKRSLCEQFISKKVLDEEYGMSKICCEEEVTTKFCPTCGKKAEDIEAIYDWEDIFDQALYNELEELCFEMGDYLYIGKELNLCDGGNVSLPEINKTFAEAKTVIEKVGLKSNKIALHYSIINN